MRTLWALSLLVVLCGAVFVTIAPVGGDGYRWWWAVFAVMALVECFSQIGSKRAASEPAPVEEEPTP